MVYNAYEEGRVPEEDTRGFFIGGLERFNEYWDRWEAPIQMIRDDFGEGD